MGLFKIIFGEKGRTDPLTDLSEIDRLSLQTLDYGNKVEFLYQPDGFYGKGRAMILGYFSGIEGNEISVGRERGSVHEGPAVVDVRNYPLKTISQISNLSDERFEKTKQIFR